jgi:membrane-associated phospholipid phosphatase
MKYTIDAERPNGGDHSFPSGHTSTSFASAEFIRGRYGWSYGIPAYVVASFVGYSRVESKQHHTRDVIAGAVIGIGSSYLFTTPYKGWQIQPLVGSSFYGIGLSRGFLSLYFLSRLPKMLRRNGLLHLSADPVFGEWSIYDYFKSK